MREKSSIIATFKMGKYWNKVCKNSFFKSNKSINNDLTTEEKLELACQEIDHLKKRMLLLEHTLEQQLVHPPNTSSHSSTDYSYFTNVQANFSSKSLPRHLHHNIVLPGNATTTPPSSSNFDSSPAAIISCKKGDSVKASVRRHRSLLSNENF